MSTRPTAPARRIHPALATMLGLSAAAVLAWGLAGGEAPGEAGADVADAHVAGAQRARPVAPASSVPLPSVQLQYREGQVLALAGTVPDEAERQALLQELARRHPGVTLDASQLRLGPVGNPAWLSARLLPDLHGLRSADVTLRDGQLTMRAVAASEPDRRQLGVRLADIAARGVDVQPSITVATAQAAQPATALR